MDTKRTINVVLADLSLAILKDQERLELAINSSVDIDKKLTDIKIILTNLVMNESIFNKFQSLVTPPIENQNLKTNEQV